MTIAHSVICKSRLLAIGALLSAVFTSLAGEAASQAASRSLFETAVAYAVGGISSSTTAADVNGDGTVDILTANCAATLADCSLAKGAGSVSVLLGNGDGTFQAARTFESGGLVAQSIAVADGTFRTVKTYDTGGKDDASVYAADVNGDGKVDALVAHGCDATGNCGAGTVSNLAGNGDGTLQSLGRSMDTPGRPYCTFSASVIVLCGFTAAAGRRWGAQNQDRACWAS
jgi:FG-GAP-like repeat